MNWQPAAEGGISLGLEHLADVVIHVEGRKILAHQQILALHSQVLCNLFIDIRADGQDEACGGLQQVGGGRPLEISSAFAGLPGADVKALLSYLYSPQKLITSVGCRRAVPWCCGRWGGRSR